MLRIVRVQLNTFFTSIIFPRLQNCLLFLLLLPLLLVLLSLIHGAGGLHGSRGAYVRMYVRKEFGISLGIVTSGLYFVFNVSCDRTKFKSLKLRKFKNELSGMLQKGFELDQPFWKLFYSIEEKCLLPLGIFWGLIPFFLIVVPAKVTALEDEKHSNFHEFFLI